jgi:hypothetical protein
VAVSSSDEEPFPEIQENSGDEDQEQRSTEKCRSPMNVSDTEEG